MPILHDDSQKVRDSQHTKDSAGSNDISFHSASIQKTVRERNVHPTPEWSGVAFSNKVEGEEQLEQRASRAPVQRLITLGFRNNESRLYFCLLFQSLGVSLPRSQPVVAQSRLYEYGLLPKLR